MNLPVIIIGAGPGGLQLGYYLQQQNIEYLIVEKESAAGGFYRTYPIHRQLISINKIHVGVGNENKSLRWDWNSLLGSDSSPRFKDYDDEYFPSADSMVRYLNDYASLNDLKIMFDTQITNISKDKNNFLLTSESGLELRAKILVIATGFSNEYTPEIPGIEYAESYGTYDRNVDGFTNKRVLVIGKGNSAFETAESLTSYAASIHLMSPGYLKQAMDTHFPGNVRSVNNNILDTFFLKQQNAVLNGTIVKIEKDADGYLVSVKYTEDGEQTELKYDRVIYCTGFEINSDMFSPKTQPELVYNGRLPALNCEWESVNVGNMFFCGTLMQTNDFRKSSSAFVAGIRYNARVLANVLGQKFKGTNYSSDLLALDSRVIYDTILDRMSSTTSLWHLYGSLCDILVCNYSDESVLHFKDIPLRVFHESDFFQGLTAFVFQFGYDNPEDPNEKCKFSEHGFLHPIVRFYYKGAYTAEAHVLEDIYADWNDEKAFGAPIKSILEECIEKYRIELVE